MPLFRGESQKIDIPEHQEYDNSRNYHYRDRNRLRADCGYKYSLYCPEFVGKGIQVLFQTSVGDDKELLKSALKLPEIG